MLYVLYGAALDIGKVSREYFQGKGIEVIEKYNFLSRNSDINTWLDEKKFVREEDINHCDFYYELNGLYVGFNKEQIIDAVHGIKDCLLTMSVTSIQFIEHLKIAYGDYVTIIYSYIDEEALDKITKSQTGISEAEIEKRMKVSKQIKKIYLENSIYFDEVVLFDNKDIFSYESLKIQYDIIISKHKKIERMLNNNRYIEIPYIGSEPYMFVSYSHRDESKVFAVLNMLQKYGFRIWYDEGIEGGTNWRLMLRDKIKQSACMLLFSSKNSVMSEAVKDEISKAEGFDIPIITVQLDSSKFDTYREEVLNMNQKINFSDIEYQKKLLKSLPTKTKNDAL